MNFFNNSTKYSENLALNILNDCGIRSRANNKRIVTEVDILTDSGKKIDVQLSTDFARYGDFRLDIVSAFYPPNKSYLNPSYIYNEEENFLQNFSHKYKCEIYKKGKIMLKDYLDFFFILFYNNKFKQDKPDYLFIISKREILAYMKDRRADLFAKIKINDKSRLDDRCGSAFIPISVRHLRNNCECFFGSPQDFYVDKAYIQSYINK